MRSLLSIALAFAAGLSFVSTAAAAEETPDLSLEKEVDSYLEEAEGSGDGNTVTWSFKNGLNWKSADGNFKGKIGGRLMIDWFWVEGDEADGFDSSDTEDGVFARRIRLFMSGTIYKNVLFKVQIDFAGGPDSAPDPQDVYLGLKNIFLNGTMKAGHFFEMFGFEENTSSKFISFVERSTVTNAFAPGRNVGIGFFHVFTEDKRIAVQYGLFRTTGAGLDVMDDGGYNFTFRIAGWFWEDEETNRIVHFGFAVSYRDPTGEENRNRARVGFGKGERWFDTGDYAADEVLLYGFEFQIVWKSFHAAAEFMASSSSAESGGEDFDFSGWYIEIGYFITGEIRNYSRSKFVNSRTKVKKNLHDGGGGWGALQILFRFESLDLNDGSILGGDGEVMTVGLNWHWNPNTRVMFNVVFLDIDNGDDDSYNGDLTILVVRWQLDF